jgi:hypothetical protein
MTEQQKGNHIIQVTAWAGLTISKLDRNEGFDCH